MMSVVFSPDGVVLEIDGEVKWELMSLLVITFISI